MTTTPRIAPLEPPYPAAAAAELARWMPPDAGVEPIALFRTIARHLPLAAAMRPLGQHLLSRALTVGRREREIVIHRVCARCGCEYEWGVHAAFFGPRVGLDDAQLHATLHGSADDPVWTSAEAGLIRLVDELHDTGRVSDALWTTLAAIWSEAQLLELLALAGWYHVIAYLANGARVPLEAFARRFPGGGG
jgi:alkylhydroperoxidase family enzyme